MTRVSLSMIVNTLFWIISPGLVACASQHRPTEGDYKAYFGVNHSHTVLSPDFRPQEDRAALAATLQAGGNARFDILNGPLEAWTEAANEAKLDFLALTDHLHGPHGDAAEDVVCGHEFPPGGYQLLVDAADRINTDPTLQGKFLAIPAMEWSVLTNNHVNILFARNAVPGWIGNGQFLDLKREYLEHPDFERGNTRLLVQMNHPSSAAIGKSYGRHLFPTGQTGDARFLNEFRSVYTFIEHVNNSDHGNSNALEENAHRDGNSLASRYRSYLNRGFRLSPVAGHDNHRANWGRHTAARTGVWAKALTPDGFVEAAKARRTFITEDNELAIVFKTGTHWMGEVVSIPEAGETRTFRVRVDQLTDTETDAVQDEGPYTIILYGDDGGPGGAGAKQVKFTHDGSEVDSIQVPQNQAVEITRQVTPGSYFYLHVREGGGKDAGGENGDAWTAPIWFSSAIAKFVWSKSSSSKVYHDRGCFVVSRIKESNRVEGNSPPTGRSKHSCPD